MSSTYLKARGAGFLIVLLGAWGGVAPFVGPLFGYRMDSLGAWTWSVERAELSVGAGAVAVLGGLLLIGWPRAVQRSGALWAGMAGVWFIVGPSFLPIWTSASPSFPAAAGSPALLRAVEAVGFAYGTGALILVLAWYAIGLLSPGRLRRSMATVEVPGRPARVPEPPPVMGAPPATGPPRAAVPSVMGEPDAAAPPAGMETRTGAVPR